MEIQAGTMLKVAVELAAACSSERLNSAAMAALTQMEDVHIAVSLKQTVCISGIVHCNSNSIYTLSQFGLTLKELTHHHHHHHCAAVVSRG